VCALSIILCYIRVRGEVNSDFSLHMLRSETWKLLTYSNILPYTTSYIHISGHFETEL